MADDPLNAVYSFVERAYIRLQAGDVLIRCMEEGNSNPIQQLVDGLVLAGPKSLSALREILAEAGQRKSQIQDDLLQVFTDLEGSLKSYGVTLAEENGESSLARLAPSRLKILLKDQGIQDEEVQKSCMRLLRDARELVISLAGHLSLLEEVERYIQDWLWGLAYQSCHQGSKKPLDTFQNWTL